MENSKIEWTDHTFNPWVGCTKISPACDHCYAEAWDKRYGGDHWGPKAPRRRTSEANWRAPLKWNRQAQEQGKRARVFCASLADVFDNRGLGSWRGDLWELIRATPDLDWLLLTKRPQNIRKMIPADWGRGWSNVWLGTTVENQEEAEKRIPALCGTPARRRFLSCEPLLGPVDLRRISVDYGGSMNAFMHGRIHWVICGGESGPGARPMHPDWARSLRDQCCEFDVPFFFKQWGNWAPLEQHEGRRDWAILDKDGGLDIPDDRWPDESAGECAIVNVGKKKTGRELDGWTWDQFPSPVFQGHRCTGIWLDEMEGQ